MNRGSRLKILQVRFNRYSALSMQTPPASCDTYDDELDRFSRFILEKK